MPLLLIFAFVAGLATAITPCILPILPALLSASAVGGRRRPLGIVLGLAITFIITIVLLAQVVKGIGLASGATREITIVVLIAFGLVLLIPELAQRVQAPLSRLARFGPKTRGDGFWSGLAVGGALGFVCAPCAGPILAAVIVTSATSGASLKIVAVAIAYSIGLAAAMSIYSFGGRAVLARVKRFAHGHIVERAMGLVLLATAVLMIFNLDVQFESSLAEDTAGNHSGVLAFFVDPTKSLENSNSVKNRLASLRPASKFAERQNAAARVDAAVAALPKLGRAPGFKDTQDWFNTPGDRPLTLAGLRGHVVLVDFWTYTCINCIRTLPFVEGLYRHYHRYGLDVVGVETPEFTFEQEAGNVRQAIQTDGITYPVVQDNHYGTWDAYGNQYWPAEYYIDASGEVRRYEPGEGGYGTDEMDVRALLLAAGAKHLPPLMTARAQTASTRLASTETYLNPQRAQAGNEDFVEPLQSGTYSYTLPASLGVNQWALGGTWKAGAQSITPAAASASIGGGVQARDVYLVMTSEGDRPRRGRVLLGGKPIAAADRGADVGPGGYFTVTGQRLYSLVKLPADETFQITVQIPRGVQAYDFTFG